MPKGFSDRKFTCPYCGKEGPGGGMKAHVRYVHETDWEAAFWSKVNKTASCWLWTAAVNTTGYGMATWQGTKNNVAHRLAWKLLKGEIPDGMEACHTCDTPRCCNPEHIFLASHAENMADCKAKRRHAHGESNKHAKLTEDKVRAIRLEYRPSVKGGPKHNAPELAKKYGVNAGTIYNAATRRTWEYVE